MNDNIFSYPAYVTWDITPECNHNCIFCYNYWREEGMWKKPEENNRRLEEIAEFIVSRKPAMVSVSGGEPLLMFERIKELVFLFRRNQIGVRIQTNGSLITEEIAEFCAANQVRMLVSFPCVKQEIFAGITNSRTTYNAVLRGLDRLYRHHVEILPNIVVIKSNLPYVKETVEFLIDNYGIKEFFISRSMCPVNVEEKFDIQKLNYDELSLLFRICENLKKKYGITIKGCGGYPFCIFPSVVSMRMFAKSCGAGENGYAIDWDGNVRACVRDKGYLGNIFQEDFLTIRKRLVSWKTELEVPAECGICNVKNVCRGGCRLNQGREKNGVDVDANPLMAPVRIAEQHRYIRIWKRYFVKKPLHIVEKNGIYRVSHSFRAIYTDRAGIELLESHKYLSVWKLMVALGLSQKSANRYMLELISSGIVR